MEKDFVFVKNEKSFHLLNLASPAWTSSFAIAEHVLEELEKNID